MEKIRKDGFRIWDIIYPVAIYYVICFIVEFLLILILPEQLQFQVLYQMVSCIVAGIFLFRFYKYQQIMRGQYRIWFAEHFDRNVQQGNNHNKTVKKGTNEDKKIKVGGTNSHYEIKKSEACLYCSKMGFGIETCLIFLSGVCTAFVLNNLIGFTGLAEKSAGYAQAASAFYTGRFVFEILALGIAVPFVEELLYRGIVYGALRRYFSLRASMLCSALLFGIVHGNLVQFIYAAIFGLLLAFLSEYTKGIYGSVLAHMAANLLSILRAETKLFSGVNNTAIQLGLTILFLLADAVIIAKIYTSWSRREKE